jgi:hypothetical protein
VYQELILLQISKALPFFPADFRGLTSSSLEGASSGSDSDDGSPSPAPSKSEASETSSLLEDIEVFLADCSSSSESGSTYDFLVVALALLDCRVGVSCAGRFEELLEAEADASFVSFRGMTVVERSLERSICGVCVCVCVCVCVRQSQEC